MMVSFEIEPIDVSVAEGNKIVSSLEMAVQSATPDAEIGRRSNDYTQDIGTILSIALAAPSIVALAKGIEVWLNRQHAVKLRFKSEGRTVELDNMTASSALEALNQLLDK